MYPMLLLKVLFTLLLALSLNLSADEYYLLPDQKSDLLHTLTSKIKRAQNIQILISKIDNTTLRRTLEKRIATGGHLSLITTNLQSAAYFAKYKDAEVYVPPTAYDAGKLTLFALLIDQSDLCIGTLSLDKKSREEQVTEVHCGTSKEEISFVQGLFKTYKERFVLYN